MVKLRGIGWLVAGLWVSGASVQAADTSWLAGAASVEITPEGPVWMAGYAARKTPSEGIMIPLHAKALALRDGQGPTLLWITCDVVGFDRPFTDLVTERLQKEHGLARESVTLFASHTHTGPILKPIGPALHNVGIDPDSPASRNNAAFRKDLENKIVRLAGEALGKLQPAKVSYSVGEAGFAMNRREPTANGIKNGVNPAGPTDHSVPVLRVTGKDGATLAVVFGYACHNTTLTDKILQLSGDYAGFAQAAIEAKHPGAVALFLTGCGGDSNPLPRGTVELGRKYGQELADAVETALTSPQLALKGRLAVAYAEPLIQFAGPTDRASYEQRLNEPGSGRQAHARRMLAAFDAKQPIRAVYPYPIQAFALGDQLTLVALAGEVVVDYAIRLRKELASEGHPLWVSAYANDVFGYVGSARVIKEGGYEGGEAYYYSTFPAPLSEEVESTIVNAVHTLVKQVRD